MQKATAIDRLTARRVRRSWDPATPRTIEIGKFLAAQAPENATINEKYRLALDENERRTEGQKWPDESMQKATGITPSRARETRNLRAPDTPHTTEVRTFLATTKAETATERYRRALQANDERPESHKWPDHSLQKAAGIYSSEATKVRQAREPTTPRTIEIGEFLAGRAPQNAPINEKYRLVLDENERRTEGQKWPDESMQKAAGIDLHRARETRNFRAPDTPRTTEVRAFLATTKAETATERYRRALQANHERIESQKWPDHSLRKAAGIYQADAARVRRNLLRETKTRKRRIPDGE
jgi:ribosomal protein S8E